MEVFRYKADRIPILLICLLTVFDVLVYFLVDSLLFVSFWAVLGLLPKICACAWNHHHQHVPTFRSTFLNRCLELVYAFQTGITTNAWVLHHNLGHHVHYLDQDKDESTWTRQDGSTMGCVEYTVKLALSGYFTAYKVGKSHERFQKGFLQMGVFVFLLLVLLFLYNWKNALLIFFLPMLIGYVFTCWHTYSHHAGLHSDNHLEASYNVMDRAYNIMTGNLGYHTAHHMKQALHWSKLPELHAQIHKDIPSQLFREPCIPFCWFRKFKGRMQVQSA